MIEGNTFKIDPDTLKSTLITESIYELPSTQLRWALVNNEKILQKKIQYSDGSSKWVDIEEIKL